MYKKITAYFLYINANKRLYFALFRLCCIMYQIGTKKPPNLIVGGLFGLLVY